MGEFKDLLDVLSDMKDEAISFVTGDPRSISAAALEGTANFPVIIPDSLSIDDGMMISKALEKKFSAFLLTVLTMNPYMSTSGDPSATKYMKKFHQNMNTSRQLGSFVESADNLYDAEYQTDWVTEALGIAYKVYEGVSYKGLNSKNAKFNYTIEEVTESGILNNKSRVTPITESGKSGKGGTYLGKDAKGTTVYAPNAKNAVSFDPTISFDPNIDVKAPRVNVPVKVNPKINASPKVNVPVNVKNVYKMPRGGGRRVAPMDHIVKNQELKKANDLVPTLLHIRVFPTDKESGDALEPIDFIIGVKATLHMVTSEDMVINIARGIRNDNWFFNFIRWTTGETKFFRDFLFAVDQMKLDAIQSNSKNGWFAALKRRKTMSKLKRRFTEENILPNATIVVTTDELNILRDQYGYDFNKNRRFVSNLMSVYFLLSFVEVDPVLQRVTFHFDGMKDADTYTYSSLNRENNVDDKQFKNMMKMLGRSM